MIWPPHYPTPEVQMTFDEKVEWLKRWDRSPELHHTVRTLVFSYRIPEAVLLLEAHIAATAHVRSQVAGWAEQWSMAIVRLQRDRTVWAIQVVQKHLRHTHSTRPAEKEESDGNV